MKYRNKIEFIKKRQNYDPNISFLRFSNASMNSNLITARQFCLLVNNHLKKEAICCPDLTCPKVPTL